MASSNPTDNLDSWATRFYALPADAPTFNIKRIQSVSPGSGATKKDRGKLILTAGKRDIVVTSYTLLQQEIELLEGTDQATKLSADELIDILRS